MVSETRRDRRDVRRYLRIVVSEPERMAEMDPPELDLALRLARRARLLGRAAARLEDAQLIEKFPSVAVDQLVSARVNADARRRLALWELNRIEHAMQLEESEPTPLVVLKGCSYILLGLPNSAGRLFADVDLLGAESKLDSVERILNRNGWRGRELTPYDDNYYRKWTHELPPLVHVEREVEIDLHHNIVPRTARLKPPAKALMAKARQLPTSGFYVLSNEDLVLHAMVHLMFDSDLGDKLRDLVDIGDLLTHFSSRDNEFWSRLIDRATDLDLSRPLFYSIRYCGRLLHVPIPEAVIGRLGQFAPDRLTLALMDRLVPRALFPTHPDRESRSARVSRLLLYARSHWLRMPPWLLAYHLTYKFFARRVSSRSWRS